MTGSVSNSLAHLGFYRVSPCRALAKIVDCYWFINTTCKVKSGYNEYLHPDGGIGIIFNYGNALTFNDKSNQSESFLDATNTRTIKLGLSGNINAIGIRFKPAGAHSFIKIPLGEIKNTSILLADIGMHSIENLYDKLQSRIGYQEKVQLIEKTLLNSLLENRKLTDVTIQACELIKGLKGMTSVNEVAIRLAVSPRKLERLFSIQLGMSPKEFSNTIRSEHARTALKQQSVSYSHIAFDLGFYDQSHFTRYFKSVVGITPGEYRKRYRDKNTTLPAVHYK